MITAEQPPVFGLTRQETAVLELIAEGLSSKEAAKRLFISKRTVDFHLANIYEKLGAKNRVQAIRLATNRGWLPAGGVS